jgi:hypothetical protein
MLGKVVYTQKHQLNETTTLVPVELSETLSRGMYQLTVHTEKGSGYRKIVVE